MSLEQASVEELKKELERRMQPEEKPEEKRYHVDIVGCDRVDEGVRHHTDDLDEAKRQARALEGYYRATIYDRQEKRLIWLNAAKVVHTFHELQPGKCPKCGIDTASDWVMNDGNETEVYYHTDPCVMCEPEHTGG